MDDIIEINYISPKSDIKFDNKMNDYYIVLTASGIENNIYVNKIKLNEIQNISETLRAIAVNKAILINKLQHPIINMRIFSYHISDSIISLLFAGSFDLNLLEYNSIQIVKLFTPSKVVGEFRSTTFVNDASLLEEKFYNYESFINHNVCMAFITKLHRKNSELPVNKTIEINIDKEKEKYIYNRYHQTIIKEQKLFPIKQYCDSNKPEDYLKFLKEYAIDVNRYNEKSLDTFKSMFMRKIKSNYRKLKYDPFLNSILSAPVDGRFIGFHINGSTQFNLDGKKYHYKDLVLKPYQLLNGSGFLARTLPNDYQRVHMPYSGYLTEIGILKNNSYIMSLRFESNYFMPPDVHEREYKSVLYGHNVQLSRAWPELVDVQPDTSLVFYLVIIGNNDSSSLNFTNKKLQGMKDKIKPNTLYKPMPHWFDKAEELLTFNCDLVGHTIFLINRKIDFTSDIKKNSDSQNKLYTYVKLKDVLGVIN